MIRSFFGKLENYKLTEIVNIITTTSMGRNRSYWAEWVDYLFSDRKYGEKLSSCLDFLQQVSINLGENTAKDLVLHDNGKAITRAFLMCRNENIVRDALNCFSAENQSELAKCVLDNAPELIIELFLGFEQETRRIDADKKIMNGSAPRLRWMNILNLVVAHADTTQLSNLINAILTQHCLDGRQISIWSDCLNTNITGIPFCAISDEEVYKLLKCAVEKCSEKTAKTLLLHDNGKVANHPRFFVERQ